jgi:nucleotide-binding universal stress UspA family protein
MPGVVVGVDQSAHSQPALRWAARYGDRRQLPVTALMAWNFVNQQHVDGSVGFDSSYDEQTAMGVLDEQIARTFDGDHRVTALVVEDEPAHALLEAATDAELLVVGARGMGGFKGLLLGSVSRSVLHRATCPVAVIRDDLDRAERPVVVGVNGDPSSIRALQWAVAHASVEGVAVHATYVWDWPPLSVAGMYGKVPDRTKLADEADQFLRRQIAAAELGDRQAIVEPKTVEGRPAGGLLEASVSAGMLVVGARGHGPIARVVLGSVSDQVAVHAICPVVVVP